MSVEWSLRLLIRQYCCLSCRGGVWQAFPVGLGIRMSPLICIFRPYCLGKISVMLRFPCQGLEEVVAVAIGNVVNKLAYFLLF